MADRMDDARELLATLRTSIGDWTWHLPLARVERAFLKVTERVADAEAEAARRTDTQVAIAEALGLRSDATGTEIVDAAKALREERSDAAEAHGALADALAAARADRDAAVARREALAGAVRAAVEHERAVTQRERDEIGAGWVGDLADVPVVAEARAALDALLTEGEVGDGR